MRIGTTILGLLLLVGLSLAAQTADTNVPSGAGVLSSLRRPSEAIAIPGPSPRTDLPGDTLHVDLEAFNNALGLTAGGVFYTAARLTPTVACTVATVVFYKRDSSNDDYLFVWGKGTSTTPGAIIESVPYSGATTMAWHTINLPVLVPLAGSSDDIWIGPRINHGAGTYPLGIDDGPAVADRGGWINSDGRWIQVSSVGFNVNWHIRAFLGRGGIPAHDVGAELVLAPIDTVVPGQIAPMARIRNFGSNPVSNVPVICQIDSVVGESIHVVFTDTAIYTGPLAPSESADVTFPKSWTGAVGSDYKVTMFTKLPEDSIYHNDTAYASVSVRPQPAAVEEQRTKLGGLIDNVLPTLVRDRVRINFTVARRCRVSLGVYDATGSPVRTLVNGTLEPGSQSATWDRTNSDGRRVANGTYFYRLTIDGRTVSSKSVLFN
ncbi:MAG: hypothetical protein NTX53_14605 [candidate division WOR-3 bacterium]|nr:hypothetical protein [candidate division WOR-3 bacterium]